MKNFCSSSLLVALTLTTAVFLFGCGGGSRDQTTGLDSGMTSGVFLDSAVEGLKFETTTQSGFTDMDGTFYYLNG